MSIENRKQSILTLPVELIFCQELKGVKMNKWSYSIFLCLPKVATLQRDAKALLVDIGVCHYTLGLSSYGSQALICF
jgi:hypothetical protein